MLEEKKESENVFTHDEQKKIQNLLRGTWMDIADDIVRIDGNRPQPRRIVVEATLDSDYLEASTRDLQDKLLVVRFRKFSFDDQKKIATMAFPYTRYS